MANHLDQADVAAVPACVMSATLDAVLQSGRARVFFEGANQRDRDLVEGVFWDLYEGDTTLGGLALIRLWSLIDVLQARRLQHMLLQRGFVFIEEVVAAAGHQRLNLDWGFMPQRIYWAVAGTEVPRDASQTTAAPGARERVQRSQNRYAPLEMAVLPAAA